MSFSQPSHKTESISDRKKSRELAEARQNGAVAPAVDVKTGAMINPHNPEFITKRPWYLEVGDTGPSLEHQGDQRLEKDRNELSLRNADRLLEKEQRLLKEKQWKGKFEVGMWVEGLKRSKLPYQVCQIVKIYKNKKEADIRFEDGTLDRKINIRKPSFGKAYIRMTRTGNRAHKIDTDQFGKETYDSKRDKYHGFETGDSHMKRMEEKFSKREELRQKYRTKAANEEKEKNGKNNVVDDDDFNDSDVEDDDSDDEFVQREEDEKIFTSRLARQGGVGGAQMKVTARNLRIREDTAKYLRNLDVNSAYYDPKSRSLRDNPNPEVAPEDSQFAGDNFARINGDAVGLAETQLFAWDAEKKGEAAIHPQANPSQAELYKKQKKSKLTKEKSMQRQSVLKKYGGAEYLDCSDGISIEQKKSSGVTARYGTSNNEGKSSAARKVRFGVSVAQEEYTRDGRLIKGGVATKREALVSKYVEDIFVNGHNTVWGSYFHKGAFRWGYADDHSLIHNSYCTGENGQKLNDETNETKYGTGVAGSIALLQAREMLKAIPNAKQKSTRNSILQVKMSKLYGEADQKAVLDKAKVDAALRQLDTTDENIQAKCQYNSLNADIEVTEEDMEAYRVRKKQRNDPMTAIGGEILLEYK